MSLDRDAKAAVLILARASWRPDEVPSNTHVDEDESDDVI